jgi:hypothetical protein
MFTADPIFAKGGNQQSRCYSYSGLDQQQQRCSICHFIYLEIVYFHGRGFFFTDCLFLMDEIFIYRLFVLLN